VSREEQDQKMRAERARKVALFRYTLIQEVIDPSLSTRQRGALVRAIAAAEHDGPFGEKVTVARNTIDRWVRWWRTGGSVRAPRRRCWTWRRG
jgi:putative transposase